MGYSPLKGGDLRPKRGLVVGSMWILGLESSSAQSLMALAGSIAFILFLVADLDNPFWGSWQVRPDAFRRALDCFCDFWPFPCCPDVLMDPPTEGRALRSVRFGDTWNED